MNETTQQINDIKSQIKILYERGNSHAMMIKSLSEQVHTANVAHDELIKKLMQKVEDNHDSYIRDLMHDNVGQLREEVDQHSQFLLLLVSQITALKLQMHGPHTAHVMDAHQSGFDHKQACASEKHPVDALASLTSAP